MHAHIKRHPWYIFYSLILNVSLQANCLPQRSCMKRVDDFIYLFIYHLFYLFIVLTYLIY